MALCTYEILFGFTFTSRTPQVFDPIPIYSTGIYGGKSYYTWYDSFLQYDFIIRWNTLESRWEFGYDDGGGFTIIAFLNTAPTDCPVNISEPYSWVVIGIDTAISDVNTALGNEIPTALTEGQECFEIQVWNKQCEFAHCVYKYLQLLQFGSAPCEALEILKNKKRILKILNCYDVRDIPNNTTDYNIFTYQEIKNLLNY